jgi:hypothetical protein
MGVVSRMVLFNDARLQRPIAEISVVFSRSAVPGSTKRRPSFDHQDQRFAKVVFNCGEA